MKINWLKLMLRIEPLIHMAIILGLFGLLILIIKLIEG